MLHKDVLMEDIDVDQWRNAQALVLDSAKERRRIIVLHDAGQIRKIAHSDRVPIVSSIERADDPEAVAKQLYESNEQSVDFVAVFERTAFDEYFARVQNSWDIEEDLDEFVQRTYSTLDEFPKGMITYPGSARETLGMQWRLGCSRDDIVTAVKNFVEPGSTIVLGAFDQDILSASLVLTFDEAWSVTSITTVDPTEVVLEGQMADVAPGIVDWTRNKYGSCSMGLFLEYSEMEAFLNAKDKANALRKSAGAQKLVLQPIPSALAEALA